MARNEKLTTNGVIAQVLVEEKSRTTPHQALTATTTPQQRKRSGKLVKKDKSKERCNYCQKKGHYGRECRKKKADEELKGGTSNKPAMQSEPPPNEKDKQKEHSARLAHTEVPSPLELFMARAGQPQDNTNQWIIDSGASATMSCRRDWFASYSKLNPPQHVTIGGGRTIDAIGIGCAAVDLPTSLHNTRAVFRNVYYVPSLDANLLSASQLARNGHKVNFESYDCCIMDKGSNLVAKAQRKGSLYVLTCTPCVMTAARIAYGPTLVADAATPLAAHTARTCISRADLITWHRRLGHINTNSVLKLFRKGMVDGMEIAGTLRHSINPCESCLEGKQTRADIPKWSHACSPRNLHRAYSDLCGPTQTTSRKGNAYFITFTDEYSHHLTVNFLWSKHEAFTALKDYW